MNTKQIGWLLVTTMTIISAHAADLFTQDFSNITDVTECVDKAPTKNQFNSLVSGGGKWSVESGQLSLLKIQNGDAQILRTTDMDGSPVSALSFSFQIDFSFTSPDGTRLLTGVMGDGALNWLSYGIDSAGDANAWRVFGDPERGRTFSGTQTLAFYLNDAGSPITYTAPDGEATSLAPDTWDLWVGKIRVFVGKSTSDTAAKLTQFGMAVRNKDGGTGTFVFDNFLVQSVSE